MASNHPITPPPELIEKWHSTSPLDRSVTVATQAARWGANQELEACCTWLINEGHEHEHNELRTARRPKPPSLKEQALEALNEAVYMADDSPPEGISTDQADIIRRALEQLDD